MLFFTRAWHRGELTDEEFERVPHEYAAHLKRILPSLPTAVQSFAREVSLHDGLFREVVVDYLQDQVTLCLRCGDLQVGYFDLDLVYEGVDLGALDLTTLRAAAEASDTEALYDEFDIDRDRGVIHRIIFRPQHQLSIVFNSMRYSSVPRADREVAAGVRFREIPEPTG